MTDNVVDPYQPISSSRVGRAPLLINLITNLQPVEFAGGVPATSKKTETYVLYSALPDELKIRIKNAVEALQSQF